MSYTHLTEYERYQIWALRHKGHTMAEIGKVIDRNKGSISRELRRNLGERGYRPKQAHGKAQQRCCEANARNVRKIHSATWEKAQQMIRQEHSPEQVSGRLRLMQGGLVSHETLYQRIYADKTNGGDLHTHLRCQKKRRKPYGSGQQRRGVIPGRVGIEHRSDAVERRSRVGHWEMDTVVGRDHKGFLVTMVERKSRVMFTVHVAQKTASAVAEAIMARLGPISKLVMTMTFDNGTEFCFHQKIAAALKCKTYFAHPYSSWERGTNENTNGLVRQYLPKKTSFSGVTQQHTRWIENRLNNRPRKCLDYQTPMEVFQRSVAGHGVALRA